MIVYAVVNKITKVEMGWYKEVYTAHLLVQKLNNNGTSQEYEVVARQHRHIR